MDYRYKTAVLSSCEKYRYMLFRSWVGVEERWNEKGVCLFVMLNPSTADWEYDDPTIRKCVSFANMWGMKSLLVLNLFAFRTPEPPALFEAAKTEDIIGPDNVSAFKEYIGHADKIVLAWGSKGTFKNQHHRVLGWLDICNKRRIPLEALKISESTGQPHHPLYIPYAQKLVEYE